MADESASAAVAEPCPVWVDGRVGDLTEPAITPDDLSFMSGYGVFEAVEVAAGRPVALDRHLARLAHSAAVAGIEVPPDERIGDAIAELWTALAVARPDVAPHAVARITLSGSGRLVVSWRAWPDRTDPAAVVTSPYRRNERSAVAGAKTTSYAEAVVAAAEARRRGGEEAILANTRDELCEGTTSNVFVVLDDRLVTPPADSGLLRGVTRDLLLESGVAVEATVALADLPQVTEAFLTSTSRRVHPIARWDDRTLTVDGPHTTAARAAWAAIAAEFG